MSYKWLTVDESTYERRDVLQTSVDARVRIHLERGFVSMGACRDTEGDYDAAFFVIYGPRGGHRGSASWDWPQVDGAMDFLFNGGVAILNGAQRGDWYLDGRWDERLLLEVAHRPVLAPAHRLAIFGPRALRASCYVSGEDLIRIACGLRIAVDEVNARIGNR